MLLRETDVEHGSPKFSQDGGNADRALRVTLLVHETQTEGDANKAEVAQLESDSTPTSQPKVARFFQEPHAGCLTSDCVVEAARLYQELLGTCNGEADVFWLHP